MNLKSNLLLSAAILCCSLLKSQSSPVKLFALKREPTAIPTDSLGSTYFYSIAFETKEGVELSSTVFTLRSIVTDSVIHQQSFNFPQADGVYQTSTFSNGLIRDKNSFFILLGNIKSLEPLRLSADFKDSLDVLYSGIMTNQ
ncbi:MAG: hypothetical protein O9353_05225 [Bacteroidia bacterium]|nr:hypothetical protein [Bacteroidia bacterium]